MRVVIAAHGFLPSVGGVSTNVAILAKSFLDKGHDVTVVTLTPGPVEGYGYEVVRNAGALKLFRLYRGADLIVLSNLAIRLIYPLVFLRRRVALQHHSESAFNLSRSWFSADMIRRDVMSRATHFMTSAYVGRKSGLPSYEITPPSANALHIKAGVVNAPACRSGALFVGRTVPEKGILWLLNRWHEIRQELGVAELRIVGKGSLDTEIRRRIQGGLQGVVHVGALPREETGREMEQCRFLLVPSLWEEPFGAVALEGLAAGALTILTDRGGLPETTGELGFFYDPDDDTSFIGALRRARRMFDAHLADAECLAAWKRACRAHVEGFSPAVNADLIIRAMAPALRRVECQIDS